MQSGYTAIEEYLSALAAGLARVALTYSGRGGVNPRQNRRDDATVI